MNEELRIKEINDIVRNLWAEKELLENAVKARDSKEIVELFPTDITDIQVSDMYVRIFVTDKLENVINDKAGRGWDHFDFVLTNEISLQGNNGQYDLTYIVPPNDIECINRNFEIIKWLKVIGIPKSVVSMTYWNSAITQNFKNVSRDNEEYLRYSARINEIYS